MVFSLKERDYLITGQISSFCFMEELRMIWESPLRAVAGDHFARIPLKKIPNSLEDSKMCASVECMSR
jgi:hypothetical protein